MLSRTLPTGGPRPGRGPAHSHTRRAAGNQQYSRLAIAVFNERDTFLSTKQLPTDDGGCQLIGRDDRRRRFVRATRRGPSRPHVGIKATPRSWPPQRRAPAYAVSQTGVSTRRRFVICVSLVL